MPQIKPSQKNSKVSVVVDAQKKDLMKEFVEKWAADEQQDCENFFLVKDLQTNGIDKRVWLGRFRVNWYHQEVPEGKTIIASNMTRSLFVVVKESLDGMYLDIPQFKD
jgi:hypothetical protein